MPIHAACSRKLLSLLRSLFVAAAIRPEVTRTRGCTIGAHWLRRAHLDAEGRLTV
jgi:hypothetical protein